MDNRIENGNNNTNRQDNSRQDALLEKLKFEVAQEMGIKSRAKNKKI